jgi:hypothetical protein
MDAPRDRLGLARWLTDPRHPLTARVAVNRYWQLFLGRGLVPTQENFGTQGKAPSHPEQLDWLARDFIHSGWNVKALAKKIVLSSAYRQPSALRPELLQRDPQNVLLARGPTGRLSAEAIRDLALAASGLLDGQSLSAGRSLARDQLHEPALPAERGQGPVSPQPLHRLEAHGAGTEHDRL